MSHYIKEEVDFDMIKIERGRRRKNLFEVVALLCLSLLTLLKFRFYDVGRYTRLRSSLPLAIVR